METTNPTPREIFRALCLANLAHSHLSECKLIADPNKFDPSKDCDIKSIRSGLKDAIDHLNQALYEVEYPALPDEVLPHA